MKGVKVKGEFNALEQLDLGIFDSFSVPCFFIDQDGRFAAANSAFYSLTGGCLEDYFGKDPYSSLAPDDIVKQHAQDSGMYETGEPVSAGILIFGVDGRPVGAQVMKKTLVRNRSDEPAGILVTLLECSELNAVGEALKAGDDKRRPLLADFPGIFCLLDRNKRAVWVSEKVLEIHDDPLGKNCREIFGDNDEIWNPCDVGADHPRKGTTKRIVKFEKLHSPDEELIYEIVPTPVRNSNGEMISVLIIGWDVSEKINLEKQLRDSRMMEAIGTLVRNISHEFNNILTPIMGYSEILSLKMQQDGIQDQIAHDYIDSILRAARRAKKLVEQILTFSRSGERKEGPQYLHPIVNEVMKLMHVLLPSTVTIREHVDESCGMVSIDSVQIQQVLINLCTNSSDAMKGRQGTLTVTLAKDDSGEGQEWIRLSVADTGCGIDEGKLERIFEPYFTTKEKGRGKGLGLAMVHSIIKRQGGRIDVRSEVGVGTTFNLYLPVARQTTNSARVVDGTDLIGGSGSILLVDDEAQVVQAAGELLAGLGYQVTGRTSPVEALKIFLENPTDYDMLLTDLTMPELTGVELCKKVKAVRSDLPVVLLTGYSEQLPRKAADEAGIDQYCMKPVSMRELSEVVYNTLARSL